MTDKLDDETLKVLEKVEKLLRLSSSNPNSEEAARAAEKAQELLTAYNLDSAMIDQTAGAQSAKRSQEKRKGGTFVYQRDLWRSVAELNFCVYWTNRTAKWVDCRDRWGDYEGTRLSWTFQHALVGRVVNVRATEAMAGYLEATIERLVMETPQINGQNNLRFSRWATSWRKGAAAQLCTRLREKVAEREAKETAEQERREAEAGRDGVSKSTALTVSSYRKSERDANMDEIYGEGWSAKIAAQRAARAEANRRAEQEYTRWAEANPEAARKEAEKRRKEHEKQMKRYRQSASRKADNVDDGAYYSGYDEAEKISLDPQVREAGERGRLS